MADIPTGSDHTDAIGRLPSPVPAEWMAATGTPPGSSRPPGDLYWRTSTYDSREHGFRELGDTTSEALCTHTVPTGLLSAAPGGRCHGCLLVLGDMLADLLGDRGRYDPR